MLSPLATRRYFALFSLFCWILAPTPSFGSQIRGKVESVNGGEPLARVQVLLVETATVTITDRNGEFQIRDIAPGAYTLRLNAVGYRLLSVPCLLNSTDDEKEFSITLVPDNFRRTDSIEVRGDIFQGPDSPAINEVNLSSTEVRETSTVLVDDPFRAIQSLPGVTAAGNNDFFAQFTVMGASYETTGTYLDGILIPPPFHGVNVAEGATLSILTSETVEDIKLLPAAYPEKYGDAVGAALDLRTREGSRTSPTFRVSVGLAAAEILGEGALGKSKKGSWLASARRSYLGYLLRNRLDDTFDDISFYDGDFKLAYDIRPNQTVTLYGVGGHTVADRVHPDYRLDPSSFKRGTNDFAMVRAGWRWAVSPTLAVDTRAAYIDSPYDTRNLFNQPLEHRTHQEWVGAGDVTWGWMNHHILDAGVMTRYARGGSRQTFYDRDDVVLSQQEQLGSGWKSDGYVQQASDFFARKLHVIASVRFDAASHFDIHPFSPQVSVGLRLTSSTQLQFGAGRYHQFEFPSVRPFVSQNTCQPGSESLQTATQYVAGLEQRLGERSRLKVTLFDRHNASSFAVTREDACGVLRFAHDFRAYAHNYSRGAQIVLQSRSASRLSGWIAYTLTYARQNFIAHLNQTPYTSPYFAALEDQRHTVNLFGSYRVSPSVHLSGKWLFGSGFPIPGVSNQTTLGDYQRLDVRSEKDWAFRRWKLALYGEVLNVTNHDNRRYFYSSYNPNGSLTVATGQGLPITPTAGVAFEF